MPDTVVSIQIKDRIGNKIAPKLLAIGESAKAAAPALAAFKTAWQGLDFSGLSGVGLGSVAQQMKRTATEAKKLEIAIERLKQSQIQTKIVTNNYQQSLNKLRIQEQKMAKEGMAKAAATTSQSMALKNLNQVTNVTAISTSDLTAKQIKSQLAINKLAISNNELRMSNEKVKMSTIDLQIKQNSLAISANAVVSSTQNVAKSQKQVTTATNAAASSTVSLNKNLNTLTVQEAKLEKEGLGAAASQNRLRAAMVGMAQSTNVTATFTSKLSKEEIKRQTSLAKLSKTQTLARKATVELAIAKAKLTGAYNRNTAATQRFDAATKKANLSVTRLVANIRRMKAAAVGNRGAIGGMVSSLRSYVSLGALVGAGGALKGIDSFKRIQNQLRGTTDSAAQLNQVTEELFGVAQRSRVPIADLTIAYRRYDNALSKTGMGQKGSLRITETIGKMLSLNGASAQESASALLQLSQAFNKGKLDGDEFRSVAELMPQILDAIAKATGKSRKELFKMSKDGEITVDVLIKAFQSLEKPIDKLMKNSVRTIGQSFTQLTNKLIYQFGQWDKKTKFTEKLAKILDEIGNNLDYILKAIRSLASGLAASGAASIIGGFFALIISGVGNLALLPGIIGLIVARIVYMGDQIKLIDLGENVFLTLTEVINSVAFNFDKVFKFLATISEDFFSVFLPTKTLGGITEVLKEVLGLVKEILLVVVGVVAGIGNAVSKLITADYTGVGLELESELDSALGRAGKNFLKFLADLPALIGNQLLVTAVDIASRLSEVIANVMIGIRDVTQSIIFGSDEKEVMNLREFANKKIAFLPREMRIGKDIEDYANQHEKYLEQFTEEETKRASKRREARANETREIAAQLRSRLEEARTIAVETQKVSAPVAFKFFENIGKGTSLFLEKSRQSFLLFETTVINSALKDKFLSFAGSIEIVNKGINILSSSANRMLDTLLSKIENPILKSALENLKESLVSTAEKISTMMGNISDSLRKGIGAYSEGGKTPVENSGLPQMTEQASALQSVFSNLSNAFQNFVRTGKLSFKELMRSILADLLKLFMNKLFQQLFQGMLGGGGGMFGGIMGFAGGGAVPSASTSFNGSGFGERFLPGGGGYDSFGFANGGFTGGRARNGIAGVVHGQEYVMPASQTAKYRSTLDAMRNGTLKTGSTAGGGVMVNVNNYTDSNVSVERNKNGELELTIREIARQQIAEQTPKLIATNLRNANSRESKALGQSTYTRRKR